MFKPAFLSAAALLVLQCLIPARADGLRMPREQGIRFDLAEMGSGGLRFNTSTGPETGIPLSAGIRPNSSAQPDPLRNSTLWADWYPLQSLGLRTSLGLSLRDNYSNGNNLDPGLQRPRAFLGLGWTSAGTSSSVGWRISADVGTSLTSLRDCSAQIGQCSTGLRPGSNGEGMRWNPFISIGASFQY